MRHSLFCILCCLCLTVSGCFFATSSPAPEQPYEPLSPVAQFIADNTSGVSSTLTDQTFGGDVRVTVEEAFMSASGETCKRATVVSSRQDMEIVVLCRNETGWRLMPRVWGHALQ